MTCCQRSYSYIYVIPIQVYTVCESLVVRLIHVRRQYLIFHFISCMIWCNRPNIAAEAPWKLTTVSQLYSGVTLKEVKFCLDGLNPSCLFKGIAKCIC